VDISLAALTQVCLGCEMPLPMLGLIPSLNFTSYEWDGTEQHFPLFLCFFKMWSMTGHP